MTLNSLNCEYSMLCIQAKLAHVCIMFTCTFHMLLNFHSKTFEINLNTRNNIYLPHEILRWQYKTRLLGNKNDEINGGSMEGHLNKADNFILCNSYEVNSL